MSDIFNVLVDPAAERAVLSGIFCYGEEAYLDVSDLISKPESFQIDVNQAIYQCYKHLFEKRESKSIDQASLISAANELSLDFIFSSPDNQSILRSVMHGQIRKENVRYMAARVQKLHIARMLRNQLSYAISDIEKITGQESVSKIISIAENTIFDFSSIINSGDENDEPELLHIGMREHLRERILNPVEQVGISSGYKYYDDYIGGGFRRKTVSLLGARTGIGKSLISDNIGFHVAYNLQIPVLYLDTEMSKEDHWYRVGANVSDNKIRDLETGKVSKDREGLNRIGPALEKIENSKFFYKNISGRPFEEILGIARRWIKQNVGFDKDGKVNDCLIIYDYIKMMSGEGISDSMQEFQVLGFMMTSLHNFAVKHDVPIFSLVQLNRDGIDKETTDVVSGSDRITWLSTNLAVYKPKSDEEIAMDGGPKFGTHKLIVIKSRHGGGTPYGDYLNLISVGERGRIVEANTHINLKKIRESGNTIEKPKEISENDIQSVPFV